MELEELKSAWNQVETPAKSREHIQSMLSENRHPVIRGIRQQLTIEIICWSIFLICYYSMFDGHLKPAWLNVILVIAVALLLIHNFMGYRFARYLIQGTSIKESLEKYFVKVKIYALISIACRLSLTAALLFFFAYGSSFAQNYLAVGMIITIFIIQLGLLSALWKRRLNSLKKTIRMFN